MNITKRKPVSAGEMIAEEFLAPLQLSRAQLAEAMGLSIEKINSLCDNRSRIDAEIALILSKVLGNTAEFWLNLQQRNDLWNALHSETCIRHIQQAKPLMAVAA